MVTDLKGQVWVEDRVDGDMSQGSKFVIILPAWKEELVLPCGRDSCITFYKSDHCVFCGLAYDNMMRVLDEFGVNRSMVQVLNVDDPDSEVKEADLIALPTIRICEEEREGYVEEDEASR